MVFVSLLTNVNTAQSICTFVDHIMYVCHLKLELCAFMFVCFFRLLEDQFTRQTHIVHNVSGEDDVWSLLHR